MHGRGKKKDKGEDEEPKNEEAISHQPGAEQKKTVSLEEKKNS